MRGDPDREPLHGRRAGAAGARLDAGSAAAGPPTTQWSGPFAIATSAPTSAASASARASVSPRRATSPLPRRRGGVHRGRATRGEREGSSGASAPAQP